MIVQSLISARLICLVGFIDYFLENPGIQIVSRTSPHDIAKGIVEWGWGVWGGRGWAVEGGG